MLRIDEKEIMNIKSTARYLVEGHGKGGKDRGMKKEGENG